MGITIIVKNRPTDEGRRKPVRPTTGERPRKRLRTFNKAVSEYRKSLRDKKGYDRSKLSRHVAKIPQEAVADVLRNDGPEAAKDTKRLIKRAEELGFDVRTGKGRI